VNPSTAPDSVVVESTGILRAEDFTPRALPIGLPPSATFVYAPVTVLPAPAAPLSALPAHTAPSAPVAAAFTKPVIRRFLLSELIFYIGQAVMVAGVGDVGFELLAGHPSLALGLAPIGGALLTLAGAIGINRQESGR
jgi:hypothetical protein